ncbi:hypothetical protein CHS0354_016511 [Potamilus streckersoni]|uniref:Uncharacterized protein n=1 Tax=Potamilus streckersoni TaxID=2493646 RepID=A0AAE0VXJ1_9BIVA|nr:hypothetical protein CHS0354_016511 [Potamilus streckersoni]
MNEEDIKQELKSLLRSLERHDKEHQFPPTEYELSTRNISAFHDREATDIIRQQRKEYYVDVAVMIDYELWEL